MDPFQQDHVSLVLGPSELDTLLQVGSHQRKVERQSRVEGKLKLLHFGDLFYQFQLAGSGRSIYNMCFLSHKHV